MKYVL